MNFSNLILKNHKSKLFLHYNSSKLYFFVNTIESDILVSDLDLSVIYDISETGPYINFKILPDYLLKILDQKQDKHSNILIQHTSANPVDKLHIGNLRIAHLGECLKRLEVYKGNTVKVHYYVNNLGAQCVKALICNLKYPNLDYNKLYSYYCNNIDKFSDSELKELIYKIEQNDKNLIKELSKIVKFNLDLIFKELQNLNIIIDQFIFESDINVQGQEFIKLLISEGIAKQKGNMVYYPINKNEIVLRKSNNCLTYISRDILYGII
jgi:arginyl-tRNA synthetase